MAFWLHVLNMVMIFAIIGFALNMLLGYGGVISIAIAAFFGVGAYTMAISTTTYGLHWTLGIVLSVLLAGLASALSAWPALRMRGEYLMLLTIALQVVVVGLFSAARGVTGGTSGISGVPRIEIFGETLRTPASFLPVSAIGLGVALAIAVAIGRSPFGLVLRAMRDDEVATEALGKNLVAVKFLVFAVSGGLAGFAGALFAPYNAFVNPTSFSLDQSIFIVAIVVLGGAGNFFGTIVGATVLVTLPEALRFLDVGTQTAAPLRNVFYGTLLILFMLFRPEGLLPEGFRFRRKARTGDTSIGSELTDDGAGRPTDPSDTASGTPSASTSGGAATLTATGLDKSFGGLRAVHDVDIALTEGIVTALVGPNGAGKTSVFNALTGFVVPDEGTIELNGQELTDVPPWKRVHHGVARTFQDVRLFPRLPVLANVTVAVPNQPGERLRSVLLNPRRTRAAQREAEQRALQCLHQVGMADRADRPLTDLSFGEQKLVSLARVMATDAEVILLDEPASGVDREWVAEIVRIVHQMAASGKTVCLVEHNLDVVSQLSSHVYFMASGEIVAVGTPQELMADRELSALYFGTPTDEAAT